ncbi:MAG: hypothetical protein KME15_19605 [Drouetiella hepatica Uher 2000/2452]|jgi:hypothetical protein|uniref:Uncharacterized protein n=1 Tax=Drouetiella hepatica Uher 2000/2452 TaxID=904376 RepID=A0A951QFE5_9CYAN|nr:hypothetical protein [Drouetiella hepatica Uher 2000/2452]
MQYETLFLYFPMVKLVAAAPAIETWVEISFDAFSNSGGFGCITCHGAVNVRSANE